MTESALTRQGYDRVAERYAAEIGDELRGKPLDRALLGTMVELAGDGPVADVGCGPGHVAAHLAGLGATVLGTDLSPAMCAIGHRSAKLPVAAADMTALPFRAGSIGGLVCLYAVIHLDDEARARAYAEFARVLRPGGHALVSFHTRDADLPAGGTKRLDEWWGHEVDLRFRFLDPTEETKLATDAGLAPTARLDREPYRDGEHPSRRTYLLLQRQ